MVSSFDDFSATLVHLTPQVDYDFLDELRRGEVRQLIVIEEEAEGVYCLTKDKLDELLLQLWLQLLIEGVACEAFID